MRKPKKEIPVSKKEEMDKHRKKFIGKRIRHKCDDAYCQMNGTVLDVQYSVGRTKSGESSDFWAIVKWDVVRGCDEGCGDCEDDCAPEEYVQAVPIDKIVLIVNDIKGYA